MGVFTRPRIDITVNADSVDAQGSRSCSGVAPVFHVIRQAGTPPWVIVGGPSLDLVQPAQFALHLFRRHEWPSDAAPMWGDYVMLMFAMLLPRPTTIPRRRPNIHVHVLAPVALHDRGEFETRGRDGLARYRARSVNFQWE